MRALTLPAVIALLAGGLAGSLATGPALASTPAALSAAAPVQATSALEPYLEPRRAALASTGYVLGDAPDSLVARDAHAVSTLGVDGVTLARDGGSVDAPDADETRLVGTAHTHGLRAELLLSNYSSRLGDFDPKAAARLLRNPNRVVAVATQLASYVASQGWDGVQVDLESMSAPDADGLLMLVHELQARMSPEKTVSIAVMASTDLDEYAARGYRLADLGQAVDTLALMTYDQHGPGWSGPGPIGAREWQQQALSAVATQVPVSRIDLGVAGYGYTWPPKRTGRTGRTLTVKQAEQLVARDGATARWKAGPGEWTARLDDGTKLWWSDARSYALRLDLASAAGAHGVALWRLGSAGPLP